MDWPALHALAVAIEALTTAGLAAQARPIASELCFDARSARGPVATVIDLGRARRSE